MTVAPADETARGHGVRRYAGYAFDLDGTVWLDDVLLPGAARTIAALRAEGSAVTFVTNKPLEPAEEYAEKLTRLGIPASPDDVVTSLDALQRYLAVFHAGATVLPIGEPLLVEKLVAWGYPQATRPQEAAVVVVSFDRTFWVSA